LQLTGVTTAASGGGGDNAICTAYFTVFTGHDDGGASSRRLQHRVERAACFEFTEYLREVRGLGVDTQHLR